MNDMFKYFEFIKLNYLNLTRIRTGAPTLHEWYKINHSNILPIFHNKIY